MIVFNYNRVLKYFEPIILLYAKRVDYDTFEDNAQYIRLFIYKHLVKFSIEQSSLKYFINLMVKTAFRRLIFDKKKQEIFEDSFSKIQTDVQFHNNCDTYDDFVSNIVVSLKDGIDVSIFYAILYNKGQKNYSQIAKMINLDYAVFLSKVEKIRKVVRVVLKGYSF